MTLQIPANLRWVAYLAGSEWPAGDEDAMWHLAEVWNDAANQLNALIPDLERVQQEALATFSGQTADAAKADFAQEFSGDNSMDNLVAAMSALGKSARDTGTEIQSTKLNIIVTLNIAAAELMYYMYLAWAFGLAVLGQMALVELFTIQAIRRFAQELVQRIDTLIEEMLTETGLWRLGKSLALKAAGGAAVGGGLGFVEEFGIEQGQVDAGHRDSLNWSQIGKSLLGGAVGGVGSAWAHGAVKFGLGEAKTILTKAVDGAVIHYTSGVVGNVAGSLPTGGGLSAKEIFGGAGGNALPGIAGDALSKHGAPTGDPTRRLAIDLGGDKDGLKKKKLPLADPENGVEPAPPYNADASPPSYNKDVSPAPNTANGSAPPNTSTASAPPNTSNGSEPPNTGPNVGNGPAAVGEDAGGTRPDAVNSNGAPAGAASSPRGGSSASNANLLSGNGTVGNQPATGASAAGRGSPMPPQSTVTRTANGAGPHSVQGSPGIAQIDSNRSPHGGVVTPDPVTAEPHPDATLTNARGPMVPPGTNQADSNPPHPLPDIATTDESSTPPPRPDPLEVVTAEPLVRTADDAPPRPELPVETTDSSGGRDVADRPSDLQRDKDAAHMRDSRGRGAASDVPARGVGSDRSVSSPAGRGRAEPTERGETVSPAHRRGSARESAGSDGAGAQRISTSEGAGVRAPGGPHAVVDGHAGPVENAVGIHREVVTDGVDEHHAGQQARALDAIAAENADAQQVWAHTGQRVHASREAVTGARATFERAQQAHQRAVDEFAAKVGGRWQERIADARDAVDRQREGWLKASHAYDEESGGPEPGQERLDRLRTEIDESAERWRQEMIRYEALLRAAPGDHHGELAAARAARDEWAAQRPDTAVRDVESVVARRADDLRVEMGNHALAAKVELRQGQLNKARAAYGVAREEFESVGREVVGQRLEVLHRAGVADRRAHDAGLTDRGALGDAARKREAAVAAAREVAAIYDEVVWRSPDVVAERVSDEQLRDRLVNGDTIERITILPEWVRRTTGMDLRETQWDAWMLGAADVKTGEGKTLISGVKIVFEALEHGSVHFWTSSDQLRSEMVDMVNKLTGGGALLPVDALRMADEGDLPEPVAGRARVFAGTAQDYEFRTLHAMRSILERLGHAGAPSAEIAALRHQLNEQPPIDVVTTVLNDAAQRYGLAERFNPFPAGRHVVDEIDTLLDGEQAVLSPGGSQDAPAHEVEHLQRVLDRVNAAEKLGLDAGHFGRAANTMGTWDARLTDDAREFLNRVPGARIDAGDPEAKLYVDAALAKWGLGRNSDWITVAGEDPHSPRKVALIASNTNDKLMSDREKQTETRLQGVGKFLDLVAGVPVKADLPDESLHVSVDQLIGSTLLAATSGWSGTAKLGGGELYDRHGILVSEVKPYYASKLQRHEPRIYPSEDAKLRGMAERIIDDAGIELIEHHGAAVGVRATGRPQWVVSFDNRNIRGDDVRVGHDHEPLSLTGWRDKHDHEKGLVDWTDQITEERARAMAAQRGLQVPTDANLRLNYTVRDARWWDEHGNGAAAEELAKADTAAWGAPGSLHFGNKNDTRGIDPSPTAESRAMGGTAVKLDGGPEYGHSPLEQARGRASRGGRGPNRDEGGTPGSYEEFLSPKNLRTRTAHDGIARQVVKFSDAIAARDTASTPAARDKAQHDLAQAEHTLGEHTAPAVAQHAHTHQLTRRHSPTHRASATKNPHPTAPPRGHHHQQRCATPAHDRAPPRRDWP
ncbi:hypothetical protein [Mycobacterium sp. 1465703.0]|uniref:WXG100-like domain-containing protein n=1 Tax=Mycobacterium sp. 1465703.0 TaxID=1834078 RepID=UPI0008006AD1|nr:hypothetical protein [Mycobacterium sp. 1465703.0]OBJ04156.1 hypothetical protein A5625_02370 [Mycobacterium sp. 1465703.0]